MTQKEALDILKTGQSAFITGAAGSGKTHLLRQYIEYLKEHEASVGITASTGIAATHMGGQTIHSWSGIGIRDSLSADEVMEIAEKPYIRSRLKNTHILILDEVSMLHHFRLDLVDTILRVVRNSNKPFGGIQVIFSGDFFQLPPVSRMGERESKFAYHADSWKELNPVVCYLEEQHRQSDKTYLNILNELRAGEVSEDSIELLRSRFDKSHDEINQPTKLYSHNLNVDAENERELAKLDDIPVEYEMVGTGRPAIVETLKKSCLAPGTLRLKVGARVMFVKNNFEEGYANGTLGTVEKCEHDSVVVRTWDDKLIVVEQESWRIEDGSKVLAEISQYPLRLAWAITVHKSQGMSLDAAVVDLSQSFEKGMGYVALSRVRTLDGLYLKGFNNMALAVHDEALKMDAHFKDKSEKHVDKITSLPSKEIAKLHKEFVTHIQGGAKKSKKDTVGATKELLLKEVPLDKIVTERKLTLGTIMDHLEKIKESDSPVSISYLRTDIPAMRYKKIVYAFGKVGMSEGGKRPLTPVKKILGDDYSFEEIRLVRLFL